MRYPEAIEIVKTIAVYGSYLRFQDSLREYKRKGTFYMSMGKLSHTLSYVLNDGTQYIFIRNASDACSPLPIDEIICNDYNCYDSNILKRLTLRLK